MFNKLLILLFLVPAVWSCENDTTYGKRKIYSVSGCVMFDISLDCSDKRDSIRIYLFHKKDTKVDSAACDNPFVFPDPEFIALDSVDIECDKFDPIKIYHGKRIQVDSAAVRAWDAIDTVYVNNPILIKGGEIFFNKCFICTTDTIYKLYR